MKTALFAILILLVTPSESHAGCDWLIKKSSSVKGTRAVSTWAELVKCDKAAAEEHFDAFMRQTGDVGTLVDLSMTGIRAEIYTPVWYMLDKIPDYSARDEVAKGVLSHCSDEPKVLEFAKAGYNGVRDRQFGQWRLGMLACETDAFVGWLEEAATNPPSAGYDDKYNTVLEAFVKHRRVEALAVLERAAIAASKGGPFPSVINQMSEAVRPSGGVGGSISDEDRARLEATMIKVANNVPPEQASLIADRLYQAGAAEAAASLLPAVYPDRVQGGGGLMYGVASVESCDGNAVVHYAAVTEPAKRWAITSDVEGPARAFKPRLKCTADGDWPVMSTAEPVANKGEISDWAEQLVQQWSEQGLAVKTREEKTIALD